MREISTEIVINAPAENVWTVLTDCECYPEWNPFIPDAKGDVREGARLVPILWCSLETNTRRGFLEMNAAPKPRVEG